MFKVNNIVHLDGKSLTCFIQNLVQISMNLVLSSKINSQKMTETKAVQKSTCVWHSWSNG